MFRNFKSAIVAVAFAAGTLLAISGPASATPAASGFAASGVAGIAADASQVTKVHRRYRRHYRHWGGGPSIYFGFGSPYYYGGYPYYYSSPYYYRPRVRRYYGGGGSRCTRAHRACVARWGYGGGNYDGCMRYENCRPR